MRFLSEELQQEGMPPASEDRRDVSPTGEAATSTAGDYPTVSPGVEIYEDDVQVGIIDLDAETYEYDGTYDELRERLETIADEGYWTHINGTVQVKGVGLGKQLLESINRHIRYREDSDAELRGVAVGFSSKYENEPSDSAKKTLETAAKLADSMPGRERSTDGPRVSAENAPDESPSDNN